MSLTLATIVFAVFILVAGSTRAEDTPTTIPPLNPDQLKSVLKERIETFGNRLSEKAVSLKKRLNGLPPSYPVETRQYAKKQTYGFENDIRPILDRKCVACHSCYEAPCQLNLAEPIGLERGASKVRVYDGTRLKDIPPTRLHIDAHDIQGWRQRGFFPVLPGYEVGGKIQSQSLLSQMLNLGRSNPLVQGKPVNRQVDLGLERENSCPAPDEFDQYVEANPHGGMPWAVAGLSDDEHDKLQRWLSEGGLIDSKFPTLSDAEKRLISSIETWFNRPDNRSRLVARYIYEHLFLGHLYFREPIAGETPRFFRLVRSSTPSGENIRPLTTTRPNDPPGSDFYYRLEALSERIVHKTHITYRLDNARLDEWQRLFFDDPWTTNTLPGYDIVERSNPFHTFKTIPARVRYQFLLNNAEFFVRNFIRGPVCNGEIATAVIRDQFWVMFEDPDSELYVNDKVYRAQVDSLLGVPGQRSALTELGPEWITYQKDRNKYLDIRQIFYAQKFPMGSQSDHIWDGDGFNTNAFLTVFRHHTNASVTRGWRGAFPWTAWLMDYPLFERTYYELVVGFDVFGSVSHQVQTRLYFDLIRNESETNYLSLMPANARKKIYSRWYQAGAKLKTKVIYHDLDTEHPSATNLTSDQPHNEFLNNILESHKALLGVDPINRCSGDCKFNATSEKTRYVNKALSKIAGRPASSLPGILQLPDVTFLRVDFPDGSYRTYSVLRNRRHSSVAFILGESLRYQEQLDTLTILPDQIGSYPNLILRVNLAELEEFSRALGHAKTNNQFKNIIKQWGVLRMDPDFWDIFHSFTSSMKAETPLEAGTYDLNRYGHW